jgi:hypothetical protein
MLLAKRSPSWTRPFAAASDPNQKDVVRHRLTQPFCPQHIPSSAGKADRIAEVLAASKPNARTVTGLPMNSIELRSQGKQRDCR